MKYTWKVIYGQYSNYSYSIEEALFTSEKAAREFVSAVKHFAVKAIAEGREPDQKVLEICHRYEGSYELEERDDSWDGALDDSWDE